MKDLVFKDEYLFLFVNYSGWLIVLIYVDNIIEMFGGVKIYLKCEDLNYMGVYKINNVIG